MYNIHEIIKRLCNNENITKKEQKLVKEYLRNGKNLIEDINKQNEEWKESGINPCELSSDGFAGDILIFEGPEKLIEGRSLMINGWKDQLSKIETKLKEIKS